MRRPKQSRDLYPKEKPDPDRWPWKEKDHPATTIFLIVGATIGFWAPVIISVAWYVIHLIITT